MACSVSASSVTRRRGHHDSRGSRASPYRSLVAVLTAAHDIPAGSLLKPADLASKQVPRASVPAGATMDTEEERRALYGAMVRRSMASGDIIHLADALRPGDHGFLAAVLKGNMRAVTVGVDAISGTAGLIWPGDRVDLILTQTIADRRCRSAAASWPKPWYPMSA